MTTNGIQKNITDYKDLSTNIKCHTCPTGVGDQLSAEGASSLCASRVCCCRIVAARCTGPADALLWLIDPSAQVIQLVPDVRGARLGCSIRCIFLFAVVGSVCLLKNGTAFVSTNFLSHTQIRLYVINILTLNSRYQIFIKGSASKVLQSNG